MVLDELAPTGYGVAQRLKVRTSVLLYKIHKLLIEGFYNFK